MARIKGSFTVFPAPAGVILQVVDLGSTNLRRSRVSGGDPTAAKVNAGLEMSFPRERG